MSRGMVTRPPGYVTEWNYSCNGPCLLVCACVCCKHMMIALTRRSEAADELEPIMSDVGLEMWLVGRFSVLNSHTMTNDKVSPQ